MICLSGKSAVMRMVEEKKLLENVSLYELSKSEPVGTKLDIVTHGIGELESEYGHVYVLSDGQKITFVNFGFGDKESVIHRAIRDAIENDPAMAEHNMVISLSLRKPKNKSYNNFFSSTILITADFPLRQIIDLPFRQVINLAHQADL